MVSFAVAWLDRKKIPVPVSCIPKAGKFMYKQQAAFKQTCYDTLIENIQAYKKQRIFTTLKTNICPNVFK